MVDNVRSRAGIDVALGGGQERLEVASTRIERHDARAAVVHADGETAGERRAPKRPAFARRIISGIQVRVDCRVRVLIAVNSITLAAPKGLESGVIPIAHVFVVGYGRQRFLADEDGVGGAVRYPR